MDKEKEKQGMDDKSLKKGNAEENESDLLGNIDDNAIEELMTMKQALEEKNELVEKLTRENSEYKGTCIQLKADFDNYKKRTREEQKDLTKFANQKLIYDLLPILDDFERAIKAGESTHVNDVFYDGVKLISRSITDLLEKKYFVKTIEAVGESFDPMKHEAVAVVEDTAFSGLKVKEVFMKGYLIDERVIRPAKVVALKGIKSQEKEAERCTEEKADRHTEELTETHPDSGADRK